jgi:hypothetical protein
MKQSNTVLENFENFMFSSSMSFYTEVPNNKEYWLLYQTWTPCELNFQKLFMLLNQRF